MYMCFCLWLQTYNTDRQVADSAGSGTAFLCGIKAHYSTIGVNQNVKYEDCGAVAANKAKSILKYAIEDGRCLTNLDN